MAGVPMNFDTNIDLGCLDIGTELLGVVGGARGGGGQLDCDPQQPTVGLACR